MAGLFVWVFGAALFADGIWVFRDAGHYYYPLYQFTGQQLAAGSPALWNPYENLGMPLAANPTSALFYPPTWIFALPVDPAWAYRLYVLGHVALALGATYGLARRWNASPGASTAAAVSYVFCGNVLYQVCNVVFLVGAAWMPLALLAADRMLCGRSLRAAAGFGAVMAAMTLGGDPQAGYHAGLLAALYAIVLWRKDRSEGEASEHVAGGTATDGAAGKLRSSGSPLRDPCGARDPHACGACYLLGARPVLLVVAAAVAFWLAAVQVLPSMQFTRFSSREINDGPRSIYELLSTRQVADQLPGPRHWSDGLLHRRVDRAMHQGHVYHFSVGPWRLAEYLWPNVMGRQFPTHRRWADAIPSEGRLWVPSLYMGIVPLLLALAAMRFRRGDARTVWLSWSAVLCVVGSLGWFGIGWILREIIAAGGGDYNSLPIGSPVGGLYWLMVVLLPGYVSFRYPAKLLTLAAIALSMLTAVGWDRVFEGASQRFRRNVATLGWVSVVGTTAAAGLWWFAPAVFRHVAPNIMFGPLDCYGAAADIFFAFTQTAVVTFLFYAFLSRAGGRSRSRQTAGLVLIVVDLGIANAWLVPTADAKLWRQPTQLADIVSSGDSAAPPRVYRQAGWLPEQWKETTSSDRLEQVLLWDRATGSPKHNLPSRFGVAEVYGTMMPSDYQVFLWYIKYRGGGMTPQGADLAAAGVDYAVLSAADSLDTDAFEKMVLRARQERGELDLPLGSASLWKTSDPLPRAWFVPEVAVLPPLETDDWRTAWKRTTEVFHPDGVPRDLRHVAVVEASAEELATAGVNRATANDSFAANATCRIVVYEPARVEVQVETPRPGLVVLAEQFYPGWQVEVERAGLGGRPAPILRTNRVMRGVWVGEGEHRLVFRYRPESVLYAGLLSAIGWLIVAMLGIMVVHRACSAQIARKSMVRNDKTPHFADDRVDGEPDSLGRGTRGTHCPGGPNQGTDRLLGFLVHPGRRMEFLPRCGGGRSLLSGLLEADPRFRGLYAQQVALRRRAVEARVRFVGTVRPRGPVQSGLCLCRGAAKGIRPDAARYLRSPAVHADRLGQVHRPAASGGRHLGRGRLEQVRRAAAGCPLRRAVRLQERDRPHLGHRRGELSPVDRLGFAIRSLPGDRRPGLRRQPVGGHGDDLRPGP